MKDKPVLDPCCGARMFWFIKRDPRVVFCDIRKETHVLPDASTKSPRALEVLPDIIADVTDLPFPDESFWHVVLDPPHLLRGGDTSWLVRKYGRLPTDWQAFLARALLECVRVLKPNGTLIFKWNECHVSLNEILNICPLIPLYGHKSGKRANTHWVAFIKAPLVDYAAGTAAGKGGGNE